MAVCVTSIHLTGPCDLEPLNWSSLPCFDFEDDWYTLHVQYESIRNLIKFNDVDITLSPKFKKTPAER